MQTLEPRSSRAAAPILFLLGGIALLGCEYEVPTGPGTGIYTPDSDGGVPGEGGPDEEQLVPACVEDTGEADDDCSGEACVPHPDPRVRCPRKSDNYRCPATIDDMFNRSSRTWCHMPSDGGHFDHRGTCFREVPTIVGNPGQQCCYDADGNDNCTGSYDEVSPVTGQGGINAAGYPGCLTRSPAAALAHCEVDVRPWCDANCGEQRCVSNGFPNLFCVFRHDRDACEASGCYWKTDDCNVRIPPVVDENGEECGEWSFERFDGCGCGFFDRVIPRV